MSTQTLNRESLKQVEAKVRKRLLERLIKAAQEEACNACVEYNKFGSFFLLRKQAEK